MTKKVKINITDFPKTDNTFFRSLQRSSQIERDKDGAMISICICLFLFFLSMDPCLDRHPYAGLNFICRLSLFVIVCMLLPVSHLYKMTGNYNTNELYCVCSLYYEWICVLSQGPAQQGRHCHWTIQMSLQRPLHTCTYSAFHSPLLLCLHLLEWTFTAVSRHIVICAALDTAVNCGAMCCTNMLDCFWMQECLLCKLHKDALNPKTVLS